jgi:hypothetical protein
VGAGAAVVFVAFVFFAFVAFVFFAFSAFVVVVGAASCANTGIASENATANVNSIIKSFFMLGLDLPMIFFHLRLEQGGGHFGANPPDSANPLKYQKLRVHGRSQSEMTGE